MVDVSSLANTTLSFAFKGVTYLGKYSAVRFSKKKQLDLTSECLTETRSIFEKLDDPAVRQALGADKDEQLVQLLYAQSELRSEVGSSLADNHGTSLSNIRELRSKADHHYRRTKAFSESVLDNVVVVKLKKDMVLNKRTVGSDAVSEANEPDSVLIHGHDSTHGEKLKSKKNKLKAKVNLTEERRMHHTHQESHFAVNQIIINNAPLSICPFCEVTSSFDSKEDLLMHMTQVHDIRKNI